MISLAPVTQWYKAKNRKTRSKVFQKGLASLVATLSYVKVPSPRKCRMMKWTANATARTTPLTRWNSQSNAPVRPDIRFKLTVTTSLM
jgi:hypothetical protein